MKRLLILLSTALATVSFGAILYTNVTAQTQSEADPYPECEEGYEFTAEVSNLRPEIGETIVYTATITNHTGNNQPHVEVGVWFGQLVFIIENFTLFMDGQAGTGSIQLTPGTVGSMFNRPYALQFDMYGKPLCSSYGEPLDIQVGNFLYLPLISK